MIIPAAAVYEKQIDGGKERDELTEFMLEYGVTSLKLLHEFDRNTSSGSGMKVRRIEEGMTNVIESSKIVSRYAKRAKEMLRVPDKDRWQQ